MIERVKPSWIVLVTLLFSVALLLAVSCGSDDDDVADGTGGSESETGGTDDETSGSGGTDAMDAGQLDGALPQPRSTGNLEAEGACIASLDSMTIDISLEGTCKPSGTECPGGTGAASDCAPDLICCIGTDQCQKASGSISGSMMSGLVESFQCVPEGSCEGVPSDVFPLSTELPVGCADGQTCCGIISESVIASISEGGMPSWDSDASTTSDAETPVTADAGQK